MLFITQTIQFNLVVNMLISHFDVCFVLKILSSPEYKYDVIFQGPGTQN
jgi:hypothetical protein